MVSAAVISPACNMYCLQRVIADFVIRQSSSAEVSPVEPVSPLGPCSPFSPGEPGNQTKGKLDVMMSVGLEYQHHLQRST